MVSVATSAADSTTRTVGAYNKERECRAAGSLPRNWHSLFQINAQPVGDAVDVVEERNDLRRVVDRAVGQPHRSQPINVGLGDGPRRAGQLDRVVAQRPIDRIEWCGGVIFLNRVYVPLILDLSPEVIRVGLDSVVTVVGTRNDDGEHLTLRSGQRRFTAHRGCVQVEHGLQRRGVLTLNLEDVVDPPGAFAGGVVDAGKQTVSLRLIDNVYEGHCNSSPSADQSPG
jgi:hypothetical protein